jgi:hypothetical protein
MVLIRADASSLGCATAAAAASSINRGVTMIDDASSINRGVTMIDDRSEACWAA